MKIGGLQKNSLIDYPGKVTCVVFASGCNFRCPYCHNPGLVTADRAHQNRLIDEKEIFSFLERRKGLLDGVVISGGEPCIQPSLPELCEKFQKMGFSVKLDTNGTRPALLQLLLTEGLVDYVAMDIKTTPDRYAAATGTAGDPSAIRDSIRLLMKQAPMYEFRTTCVKPFIDRSAVTGIGRMIEGAIQYTLQRCMCNVDVLDPDFFKTGRRCFSHRELLQLKSAAEPFVRQCTLR